MPEPNWANRNISMSEETRSALRSIQASMQDARKTAERLENRLAPYMEETRKKAESASQRFREITAKVPAGFRVIEELGWFPDLNMDPGMLYRFAKVEPQAVEKELGDWFRGQLREIEAELIKSHPQRAGTNTRGLLGA